MLKTCQVCNQVINNYWLVGTKKHYLCWDHYVEKVQAGEIVIRARPINYYYERESLDNAWS